MKYVLASIFVSVLGGCSLLNQASEKVGESIGESTPFSGGLAAAAAMGVPMRCTYQIDDGEYEGVVKGENFRGKMETDEGDVGEVIMKDDCMWSWSSDQAKGVMFCVEPSEVAGEEAEEDTSIFDAPEADEIDMEMSCVPAMVSDDEFIPPADIEFEDLNSMMESLNQMQDSGDIPSSEELQKLMQDQGIEYPIE